MSDLQGSLNRLVIDGVLLEPVQVRYSPAGVPIGRFTLVHESDQPEAGVLRSQRFRIGARAAGHDLCRQLSELPVGTSLRVKGHLARSQQRDDAYRLLVNVQRLEVLTSNSEVGV